MRQLIRIARLGFAAALLLGIAPTAQSGPLDDAKAAGYVGERPDGSVGIVKADAPRDVKTLVDEINAERRKKYQSIARENGIPVEAVAAQAGAKLIDRTPTGQYVMSADGKWVRKK